MTARRAPSGTSPVSRVLVRVRPGVAETPTTATPALLPQARWRNRGAR
jgi:hypothetical protein